MKAILFGGAAGAMFTTGITGNIGLLTISAVMLLLAAMVA